MGASTHCHAPLQNVDRYLQPNLTTHVIALLASVAESIDLAAQRADQGNTAAGKGTMAKATKNKKPNVSPACAPVSELPCIFPC